MKHISILLFLVVIFPVEGRKLTLVELQDLAYKNSKNIKAIDLELKISSINKKMAKARMYPKLGLELEREWLYSSKQESNESLVSLYSEINLFNGFRDQNLIKKLGLKKNYKEEQLKNSIYILNKNLEDLYYQYLYIKKKLTILQGETKRIRSHKGYIEKRFSSSLISDSDVTQFELYQKEIESLKNHLLLEKRQMLSHIYIIIGESVESEIRLEGEIPHLKLKTDVYELLKSIDKSPSLKTMYYQKQLIELNQMNITAEWLPRVDLKAEHGYLDEIETGISSDMRSSKVSVSLNWEFYSGRRTSQKQEIHNLDKRKHYFKQQDEKINLKILVNNLFGRIKLLEETIKYEEQNERLANKLYKQTFSEYKKGIKDSSALVDSSRKISNAQNRVFKRKLDYIEAKLKLERTLGYNLSFHRVHE